jgi:hypothetical protein
MRFKGTLILLLICLALGGYLYFYEIKGGEEREKAKQAEKQICKLEDKDIQEIDLISNSQRIAAVRKGDKEWILTEPRQWDADAGEINRLVNSALDLRREEALDLENADLSKFGLDPVQSSLKLKSKEGKECAIDFGNNDPSGNSTYAKLANQKAIFLVASYAASAFNKKVEDLRNHSVLSFEQLEAQTLSMKSPKGDVELIKDNTDRWWLTGTEKKAADSPEVRGILNTLSMGKIKEFFDDDAEDYRNTGLDKPFIDVRLTYGKNKAIKHLIIGSEKSKLQKKGKPGSSSSNPASPELYLARDESRPDLFFVDKEFVDKLLKAPNDLRDKALAAFQRWEIDSILLKNTKGSFSFTKSDGEWLLSGTKKKANWEAINGILDAMEKPVKEWIDNPGPLATYGLDKPLIHIALKKGDNVMVDCSLGGAAKDGGIYAMVKGDSSVKIADPHGIDFLDRSEADYIEATKAASVPDSTQ